MSTTISGTNGVTFPDSTSMQTGQQACKAWVNFNGTGTVAIRESYNVSSITDNGTGFWAVNLLTAMPDANYAIAVSAGSPASRDGGAYAPATTNPTTTSFKIRGWGSNAPDTPYDHTYVLAVIFSN